MLEKFAERVRSININQILNEVLNDQRFFILDLIRSQLIDAKGGDGNLKDYAWYRKGSLLSKWWIEHKHKQGLFPGKGDPGYDLFGETGNFYKSLVITIHADRIETASLDPKLPLIEDKTEMDISGGHVLELNQDSLQLLINRIKPLIQNKIRGKLGI